METKRKNNRKFVALTSLGILLLMLIVLAVDFGSAEGMQGQGLGPDQPVRIIHLSPGVNGLGFGTVRMQAGYDDTHPVYPGFPPSMVYSVHNLPSLPFYHGGANTDGASFYAIYLTVGSSERKRIQSFNTSPTATGIGSHTSRVFLGFLDETALETEDLLVEVVIEQDDGADETTPALVGEDLI